MHTGHAPSRRSLFPVICGVLPVLVVVMPMQNARGAVTADDPTVTVGDLGLLLMPLTREELVAEADAWQRRLKSKVAELSDAQITLEGLNRQMRENQDAAETERLSQLKTAQLEHINLLREERTALIDRMNAVIEALKAKGGDIAAYEQYVNAVSGITLDVADTSAVWNTIVGWLESREGGVRWAKNIVLFIVTLLVFYVVAKIAGKATRKAMSYTKTTSDLLRDFVVKSVYRTILFVGLLVAITMLEVNVGPLLAVVGAAGFVVAFALQDTLSNFASGLMMLGYRPFDVGDIIEAAGIKGTVESMTLVSTNIKTFDNQRVIVPNNSIWGGVITNATGLPVRRVDMVFGISYSDDMGKAVDVLKGILASHPKVLDDPEPVVRVHELGDSSVNLVCRPWAKTADYWEVYWDVTRAAKEQFDANDISIPFPQRDVHLHKTDAGESA